MKYIFVLLVFLSVNCLAQEESTIKTHSTDEFSVNYPSDWELNTSGQMSTSFILIADRKSEDDKFLENVNLMIQDLTAAQLDLDGFVALTSNQLKKMLPNSPMLKNDRLKDASGAEYHVLEYKGPEGPEQLLYIHYMRVVGVKAFLLTFSGKLSDFKDYEKEARDIMDSFALK